MWTIVRDMALNEKMRFPPGRDIVLDIKTLMQYAGNASLEDTPSSFIHNFLTEETSLNTTGSPILQDYKRKLRKYPHLRVTGAVLNIYLRYYNPLAYGHVEKSLKNAGKPVCYMDVELIRDWNSAPTVDYMNASLNGEADFREDYFYGVSVRFKVSGSYAFYDPVKIFQFFASAIVYFILPTFIMSLLTKFCLGTMSELYYSAQILTLDYWGVFTGEVIRALTGMNCFNSLILDDNSSWKLNEKGRPALDWPTLKKEIIDLFDEQEQIDDNELSTLLNVYLDLLSSKDPHTGLINRLIDQKKFVEKFVNNDMAIRLGKPLRHG